MTPIIPILPISWIPVHSSAFILPSTLALSESSSAISTLQLFGESACPFSSASAFAICQAFNASNTSGFVLSPIAGLRLGCTGSQVSACASWDRAEIGGISIMPITFENAYYGSLAADAIAMPVHWYYDREALRTEYGDITTYLSPKNPHSGSILWRSQYTALNEKGEILHDQAQFWGLRGIHYHQFLKAGENTLNFQLATELVLLCAERGGYDPDEWLARYIDFMLTPGSHRDTYLEEYHRGFFTKYSQGKIPRKCSINDEHIGGLAQVAALCFVLHDLDLTELRAAVKEHVGLTHAHANVLRAADTLARLLFRIREGIPLREAIQREAGDWISPTKAEHWSTQPDTHVIGQRFSPACYIAESMPASLYLAWKYHDDFSAAIIANAMVGGDNCHRGAVVGALVGAACGVHDRWLQDLKAHHSAPTTTSPAD